MRMLLNGFLVVHCYLYALLSIAIISTHLHQWRDVYLRERTDTQNLVQILR